MDLYTVTSRAVSRQITERYSTSFGWSVRLIDISLRDDIYAIYGLVRIADEIVDSYVGSDAGLLLDSLEEEVFNSIDRGYSTNPIVHSFQATAVTYGISKTLIRPFFASMRTDISPTRHYSQKAYEAYIHGSAEVVGLMCLKVFVRGDRQRYALLKHGAMRLGAAYQKVNFLRDFAVDSQQLGRVYFPNIANRRIDDAEKSAIVADIHTDFAAAKPYIMALPHEARTAVAVSYSYYKALLDKLDATPAAVICMKRIRISNLKKVLLMLGTVITYAIRPQGRVYQT
jgi:15-cis-phytoene synthase